MSMLDQDTAKKIADSLGPANDAEHPRPLPLTFDAFRAANVANAMTLARRPAYSRCSTSCGTPCDMRTTKVF